tara:strand:+ start:22462 stop:22596 length:135 start_codon:yes stop_codon:yes gene_type:complete
MGVEKEILAFLCRPGAKNCRFDDNCPVNPLWISQLRLGTIIAIT